jgi:hypothetical protein
MDGEIGCSSAEEVLWALKGDEGQTRGKLPADALTTFDVEWKLSGDRTVTAHYLCSWIGTGAIPSVESAFRNLLAGAQIEGEDNLLWHDVTRDQLIGSQSQLYRFDREDVRLTVVECADRRTGRIHTIVFNMLAGKNGPSDPPELRRPERWAWRVVPDGMGRVIKEKLSLEVANEEILSLANSDSRDYRKSRLRDLARIFGSAASSGIYGHDSMISRDAVMLVHRVLLEVQETALANLAATDEEFTGMLNTSFEILMSRASRIESASQS